MITPVCRVCDRRDASTNCGGCGAQLCHSSSCSEPCRNENCSERICISCACRSAECSACVRLMVKRMAVQTARPGAFLRAMAKV